ncbi:uncharacterized protein si:dkey-100n23.5 isoform X3 [Cyclopterus lumpus]|uniref:uncharacterized protein si:dkey-100n23.5 isoform X3 n=1 Tax=Cyclopterus lumpus TaxID=8103 RepID=UPI001486B2BF|nr:uncharacterized protein si:dkey-100n23.5 isoform X3 [Cyclopterus lumpus]
MKYPHGSCAVNLLFHLASWIFRLLLALFLPPSDTFIPARTHTHTHTGTHGHTHTHIHTNTRTHKYIHVHTRTRTHLRRQEAELAVAGDVRASHHDGHYQCGLLFAFWWKTRPASVQPITCSQHAPRWKLGSEVQYIRLACARANTRTHLSLAEEIKPLKWYPSVYLLVSIFPLINRLHNAFYPQDPSFPLTLLHVLSVPLHGLANAFVFGLDRDWWSLLSPTGMQLALQSRLCDRTRIGEYHPGAVRYTQADLVDLSDDDDDDTNVLFYSPDMTLKDRGP